MPSFRAKVLPGMEWEFCPKKGPLCGHIVGEICPWTGGHNPRVAAYEEPRNDLETPGGGEVGSRSTEDAEGPQISDPVNHPSHYTQYPVEVIEITERLNFLLGNVVKYVLRADYKGKPIEDLEKARWYLDREIANRKST